MTSDPQKQITQLNLRISVLHAIIRELNGTITRLRAETARRDIDDLTGLGNRHWLRHWWDLHRSTVASVILIDLDNFKAVNDTLGHLAGDQVLTQVGNAILACSDLGVRLGGDEFLILVRHENPYSLARQVAHLVREGTPGIGQEMSIGISPVTGTLSEALTEADAEMYRIKRAKHVKHAT